MAEDTEPVAQRGRRYAAERVVEIWDNVQKNNLWKRILKNVIATTLLGRHDRDHPVETSRLNQ